MNGGKTPAASRTVLSQIMGIAESNLAGFVHGGSIMRLVDEASGTAAARHSGNRVVTAAMDEMSFIEPVHLGDVVTLRAQVNDVGKTSMEVGCRVESENIRTGKKRHVSSAYLVFVSLDDAGAPAPVPPLIAEDEEDRRRMAEAKIRRAHRLARKAEIVARRAAEDG
ncbi:MAG: acyl-CoA thioesterase [Actinomycetota bacterium]|nr:acyl-CoA thioesterase [Actinomycetota bacterium]